MPSETLETPAYQLKTERNLKYQKNFGEFVMASNIAIKNIFGFLRRSYHKTSFLISKRDFE